MDNDAIIMLSGAIIRRAIQDLKSGNNYTRTQAEKFFKSEWFEMLAMGHAEEIRSTIKRVYGYETTRNDNQGTTNTNKKHG